MNIYREMTLDEYSIDMESEDPSCSYLAYMDPDGGGWSRLSSRPLVEVEKCVHGKYDAHGSGVGMNRIVCPGVGLEANE